MKNYHIAVIDIGKTNKKILIYNQDLRIVDERFIRIPEIEEDGILYDDVERLKAWILNTFSSLSAVYAIRVIATSAHGATYSLVDEHLNHAVPQIAYNTDPGEDFHSQFYRLCGDPNELQVTTATPNFNLLINTAKGIYLSQKKFPEQFGQVKHVILYAQFFSAWLTGSVCCDPTYTGNHTYLWDFAKQDWSAVADSLGIRHLLPKAMKNPWDTIGTIRSEIASATGLSPDTLVTAGIHDSNAAMLPYMLSMKEPFLLNSTGTWCVIMNEKEEVKFEADELGKVVFYNMNAFRKPVKTAIFLGGMEFEHYANLLMKRHGRTDIPPFDQERTQQIIDENQLFILPSVAKGIGQFPASQPRLVDGKNSYSLHDVETGLSNPEFLGDYETAFAVLNLSLAIQTKVSFERADYTPGMVVFTEGGFSKNDTYNNLLSAFFPQSTFYLTALKEASAYGAAICGKVSVEGTNIHLLGELIHIEKRAIPACPLRGLENYSKKFISYV